MESSKDHEGDKLDNFEGSSGCGSDLSVNNFSLNISSDDDKQKSKILDKEQRSIFDYAYRCARDNIKNRSCEHPQEVRPTDLFVKGKGGCGKSHVRKQIIKPSLKS